MFSGKWSNSSESAASIILLSRSNFLQVSLTRSGFGIGSRLAIAKYLTQEDTLEFRGCILIFAALQLLRSLHGADAGDAAQAEDHAIQVAHVFGFGNQIDDGFAVL